MRQETSTIYIADDGKRFTSEEECRRYESRVLERVAKMSFFCVRHNPDTTETGLPMAVTFFAVEGLWGEHAVMDYCFTSFGRPFAYVQGVAAVPNWTISLLTSGKELEIWREAIDPQGKLGVKWGGMLNKAKAVFLSDDPTPIEGWPYPVTIHRHLTGSEALTK